MKATALFAAIAALAILAGAYSTTRQHAEREAWRLESARLSAKIANLKRPETAGSEHRSPNIEETADLEEALTRLTELESQILDRRAELAQLKSDRLVADDRARSALDTLRQQVQRTTEIQLDLGALQSRRLQMRRRIAKAEEQLDQVQNTITTRQQHVALLDRKIAELVIRQEVAKSRLDVAEQEEGASEHGALAVLKAAKDITNPTTPAVTTIMAVAPRSAPTQPVETKKALAAPTSRDKGAGRSNQDRSKGLYRFKRLAVDAYLDGPTPPTDQEQGVAKASDRGDEQTASDAWASQQYQLGIALVSRGERNSGTRELNEAVLAFRAVLGEWPKKRDQLRWAVTQNDLGYALALLGQRKRDAGLFEEAAIACRKALREIRQDQTPLLWATAQHNLGITLSGLATIKDDAILWQNAIKALQQSMEVFEEAGAGPEAERTKSRLKSAHDQLTVLKRDS